ncbi:MAG: sugar phosphate isomerase/epimerase, partial [bacterium]
ITKSIIAAKDRLFHFHVADSNRWYPGAGHINFKEIVDTLAQIDFQGFVSAEILPLPDPDTAAERNIEYMKKY